MKNFVLTALALVIGTASLFATNFDSGTSKKEIRNQIVKLLETPILNIGEELNVTITFTFSSEGEIIVLNVDSNNHDILDYVRENLNYKKIQSPGEMNKIYNMPLKVKAE